uniref:Putative secreted protein n=1 Tax=Anopheles darlingi TaxID=43151 RepID=A0A2M4DJL5_ANODA
MFRAICRPVSMLILACPGAHCFVTYTTFLRDDTSANEAKLRFAIEYTDTIFLLLKERIVFRLYTFSFKK